MGDSVTTPDPLVEVGWLAGTTVLEVTTGVAGPLVGRILGELGADVVKVESRGKPDVNRARVARPGDPAGFPAHEAFQLLHEANAGKRSITIDLKTEEGRELFDRLLGAADVFVENFAPGWLDRLGMPIRVLRERHPSLVVLSASGYGQTGPMRSQRAYAPVMTALAGVEGLIGYGDDDVTGAMALALADLNCSYYGACLVMAALAGRAATGLGQHIDLSQTEAAAALVGEAFVEQQLGTAPGPRGNTGPNGESWHVVSTGADEWVAVAGSPYRPPSVAGGRPAAADRLGRDGTEAAAVLTPAEVASSADLWTRGLFQTVPHPLLEEVTVTGLPWHVDGAAIRVRAAAPQLGAHTSEVLEERLGLTPAEISSLDRAGVLR
ncbi:MAG: hypothetical protein ABS81_02690 [Pseudonocardia sp. SCN 72-86]|nr:MAG: hypothetical protein ABS81_02690 [Pseudonocardia sp. SCN 72-86]